MSKKERNEKSYYSRTYALIVATIVLIIGSAIVAFITQETREFIETGRGGLRGLRIPLLVVVILLTTGVYRAMRRED